jgi:hypothetical protein
MIEMKCMSMRLLRYAPMVGLLSVYAITTGCDAIRIQNGGGNSVGLLIDAESSSGFVNDRPVVTSLTEFATTNYRSSSLSNEIVGFTNDRPPKRVATPWTPQRDRALTDARLAGAESLRALGHWPG